MTINHQLTRSSSARQAGGAGARRTDRLRTIPGLIGIGYTLSWIAGLAIPAPSPSFGASGAQIVSASTGHAPALVVQFLLTEGLPAAGIAVVSVTLARFARSRLALVAGAAAALISLLQFSLGCWVAATTSPATAHILYQMLNRMDGVKMLFLAVVGCAAAAAAAMPRWLRLTGAALAVTMAVSGVVYLLLAQGLAIAAGPALVMLLVFMTGAGIWLGGRQRRDSCPEPD
jgi:hypothetical protein